MLAASEETLPVPEEAAVAEDAAASLEEVEEEGAEGAGDAAMAEPAEAEEVLEPEAKRLRLSTEASAPEAGSNEPLLTDSGTMDGAADAAAIAPEAAAPAGGADAEEANTAGGEPLGGSAEPEDPEKGVADLLEIDGSALEGGGQLLRSACAYAALLGRHIRISKIRAGRSRPGLAAQHLAAVKLLNDVCCGTTLAGGEVGSRDLTFKPGTLAAGSFSTDPTGSRSGAITLAVQAALFPLLFAGGGSTCELCGGTDVPFSPPLDFLRRVLQPTLARMGAFLSLDCTSRGFLPGGGGRVRLEVPKLRQPLRALDLSVRGRVTNVHVVLHSTQTMGGVHKNTSLCEAVRGATAHLAPDVKVDLELEAAPEGRLKYWVDIIAETTEGALFHSAMEPKDLPYVGRLRQMPELFAAAARMAGEDLIRQLDSGASVGSHLCDQLILPASLAQGTTRLLVAELSLHTQTALHVAQLMLPELRIRQEGMDDGLTLLEIEGVGHGSAFMEDLRSATPEMPTWGTLAKASSKAAAKTLSAPPVLVAMPKSRAAPAGPAVLPAEAVVAPAEQQEAEEVPPLLLPVEGTVPTTEVAAAPTATPGGAEEVQAGEDEEILQLSNGVLTGAEDDLMLEFGNDMLELAEGTEIAVEVLRAHNSIRIRGSAKARREAMPDLREILNFYFPDD